MGEVLTKISLETTVISKAQYLGFYRGMYTYVQYIGYKFIREIDFSHHKEKLLNEFRQGFKVLI